MADSVIAPTTATFAPGNDVVGLVVNTALPAELAAWQPLAGATTYKVSSAQVTYNSAWNPSATTPQIKYTFIAFASNSFNAGIFWGVAVVDNASVSATAKIVPQFELGAGQGHDGTYTETSFGFFGHNESRPQHIGVFGDNDLDGNGFLGVYDEAGLALANVLSSADSNDDGVRGGSVQTWSRSSATGG